ncbi:unnamed protein product, partial [Amoebophrya sp. A120]
KTKKPRGLSPTNLGSFGDLSAAPLGEDDDGSDSEKTSHQTVTDVSLSKPGFTDEDEEDLPPPVDLLEAGTSTSILETASVVSGGTTTNKGEQSSSTT